jgi:hypothetical protein
MRLTLPIAAAVALAIAAPGAGAARKSCAAPGSETVRANDVARLYSQGPAGSERLRGCLRSRGAGRSILLAENYDDGIYETGTWDRVRLWRRFAAWRYTATDVSCKTECPPGYGYAVTRRVRDLATGRSLTRPEEFRLGRSFVLTSTRVIATALERADEVRLRAWDGGESRLLDSGAIDPRSLEAHGARIVWVKDGVRKRLRLEPAAPR